MSTSARRRPRRPSPRRLRRRPDHRTHRLRRRRGHRLRRLRAHGSGGLSDDAADPARGPRRARFSIPEVNDDGVVTRENHAVLCLAAGNRGVVPPSACGYLLVPTYDLKIRWWGGAGGISTEFIGADVPRSSLGTEDPVNGDGKSRRGQIDASINSWASRYQVEVAAGGIRRDPGGARLDDRMRPVGPRRVSRSPEIVIATDVSRAR